MLGGAHLGKLPIEPGEVGEQVGAIVLDRAHHVVRAALLDQAPGGVVVGVHRVEGHDAAGVAQRLPVRRPVARAGESASIDKRFCDQDRVAVQCVEVAREPAKAQPQHPRSEVCRGAR